jgi:hypothetical protein
VHVTTETLAPLTMSARMAHVAAAKLQIVVMKTPVQMIHVLMVFVSTLPTTPSATTTTPAPSKTRALLASACRAVPSIVMTAMSVPPILATPIVAAPTPQIASHATMVMPVLQRTFAPMSSVSERES